MSKDKNSDFVFTVPSVIGTQGYVQFEMLTGGIAGTYKVCSV